MATKALGYVLPIQDRLTVILSVTWGRRKSEFGVWSMALSLHELLMVYAHTGIPLPWPAIASF